MDFVYKHILFMIAYMNLIQTKKYNKFYLNDKSYGIEMIKTKTNFNHNIKVGSKYHKNSRTNGGWSNRANNNNY
jgi:hypothetical protein